MADHAIASARGIAVSIPIAEQVKLTLSVSDTGVGLPAGRMPRMAMAPAGSEVFIIDDDDMYARHTKR